LTDPNMSAIQPAWAPDGDRVAYSAAPAAPDAQIDDPESIDAFSKRKLWMMNADGSGRRQLTDDPRYRDEAPHWTPDGTHILFGRIELSEPGTQVSLWLLDVTTGELKQVAGNVRTSLDRLQGGLYDVRSDQRAFSGQLFSYWRP
jgi:Tol biopolymer transport system component